MAKINPNFSVRPVCAGWFCRVLVQNEKVKDADCQYYDAGEIGKIKEEKGLIYYGPLPISSLGEGVSVAEKLACVLSGKNECWARDGTMSEKMEAMTAEQLDVISSRLHHVHFGRWGHGYSLLTRCNVITCEGNHIILFLHPDTSKNERIMEFVAHSRQDMWALLTEVKRLQAENLRLEKDAAQLADFLSNIDGYFSECSPCPANLEWLDFECPHKREKAAFGCNDYEVDCWRAAARKATSKEEGND